MYPFPQQNIHRLLYQGIQTLATCKAFQTRLYFDQPIRVATFSSFRTVGMLPLGRSACLVANAHGLCRVWHNEHSSHLGHVVAVVYYK
jgi:hypothetical protein